MVVPAQRGVNRMALSLLGSATWSVLDFVRTDLRTVRLAIVKGDRSDRVIHPSQVAGHDDPPYAEHGNEEGGARLGKVHVSACAGSGRVKCRAQFHRPHLPRFSIHI